MKKEKKILVVGSMNVDMVVKTSRIPRVGETLLGGVFNQYEGGKGANQAVAANAIFPGTAFCAGVGGDTIGAEYLKYLRGRGLDVSLVRSFKGAHTGVALITVAKEGKNSITVAPGANMLLSPADMRKIDFSKFSHAAFQLENSLETVEAGLEQAKLASCVTILTPAPGRLLPNSVLKNVDYLVPNEIEILQLKRGYASIDSAAAGLLKSGVGNIIVTLGERGCVYFNGEGKTSFRPCSVRAVDTVGAGDCFTGSFMAGLRIYGGDVGKAIKLATAAAAIKVTKAGAQSVGTFAEVKRMLKKF